MRGRNLVCLSIVLCAVLVVLMMSQSTTVHRAFSSSSSRQTLQKLLDDNDISSKAAFPSLPSMSLTLRLHSHPKLLKFLYCDLLRSTALYWSTQFGNVTLILDQYSDQDKQLATNLANNQHLMGINFNFVYEPLPNDPTILKSSSGRSLGYNRQLYSSFITDLSIQSSVVAWIDSDSMFITPVTPTNIIHNGKLRVVGMNTFKNSWMKKWDDLTKMMIGKPMLADFMTYFPVYVWRDTISNCRKYITEHMKAKSFDEAFRATGAQGFMSPVNVIMSYAFYFEHSRYDWHIDVQPQSSGQVSLEDYNKVHVAPGHELNHTHTSMDHHVAVHTKYYKKSVTKQAYCSAVNNTHIGQVPETKTMCRQFQGKVMWPLFEVCTNPTQNHFNGWCKNENPKCASLLNQHYSNVRQAVMDGIYDLDLSKVKAVETAADEMKITCNPYF